MDETSGTRSDATSTNDLADNNTVLYATGTINNSADFESSNSEYFTIADASHNLDITNDMTLSAWVYFETTPGDGSDQGIHWIWSNPSNRQYGFILQQDAGASNDDIVMYNDSTCTDASDVGLATVDMGVDFTTTEWHHYVWVYDASAGELEAYLDGSSVGTGTGLDTSNASCTASVNVANNWGPHMDGRFDEMGVWSRKLTPDEVSDLYNSGAGCSYDDLETCGTGGGGGGGDTVIFSAGNSIYELVDIVCTGTGTTTCNYNYATDTYSVHYLSAEAQQMSTLALLLIMATLVASVLAMGVIWIIRA